MKVNDLAARNEKQPPSKSLTTDDREAQSYIDSTAMGGKGMNVVASKVGDAANSAK